MEFSINTTTGVPIYEQLAGQICTAIARGRLHADERLPSVRELSQTLVVNPNTVARAYTELEREGALYTRPGMGVFVSKPAPTPSKEVRRERLRAPLEQLLVQAVRLGCEPQEVSELLDEQMQHYQWQSAATKPL